MVKLEEVPDESYENPQSGPVGDENDWEDDTDGTDSQLSDDDDDISDIYATEQESIFDRIYALKDIISPSTRKSLTRFWRTGTAYFSAGLLWSGKALWVVGSSALLLGVPWALAYTEEQQMIEMEREMRMQQTSAELLTPGASTQQIGGAKPAI